MRIFFKCKADTLCAKDAVGLDALSDDDRLEEEKKRTTKTMLLFPAKWFQICQSQFYCAPKVLISILIKNKGTLHKCK